MNRIFFTADLHFGHRNVLRHCPKRPFATQNDTEAHDNWLTDLWNTKIDRRDTVYILGDLTFYDRKKARALIERLNGRKHLITGNHDCAAKLPTDCFETISPLIDIVIKPVDVPYLRENLFVTMCHYPLLSWNKKSYGAVMLHGHCHGNMDTYNAESGELRFDVGVDGELAQGKDWILGLETIYTAIVEKTGGESPVNYASRNYRKRE